MAVEAEGFTAEEAVEGSMAAVAAEGTFPALAGVTSLAVVAVFMEAVREWRHGWAAARTAGWVEMDESLRTITRTGIAEVLTAEIG